MKWEMPSQPAVEVRCLGLHLLPRFLQCPSQLHWRGAGPSQGIGRQFRQPENECQSNASWVLGGYTSIFVCVHWALMVISFAWKVIPLTLASGFYLVIFRVEELIKIFRVSRKLFSQTGRQFSIFLGRLPCLADEESRPGWVSTRPAASVGRPPVLVCGVGSWVQPRGGSVVSPASTGFLICTIGITMSSVMFLVIFLSYIFSGCPKGLHYASWIYCSLLHS